MNRVIAGLILTLFLAPLYAETKLRLVEVITSPARTETLKTLVFEFEQQHPGVTVEIISIPWEQGFERFATLILGGKPPDVVEMPDRWLSLYANNDMLLSLEDNIQHWEHTETLTQKALDMGRSANSTLFTVPYGFYLRAMFYNRELLTKAGVEAPPTTMAEFMEASRKVSQLKGKYGYCFRGGQGGIGGWLMFAATMNGSNQFFTQDGQSRLNEPNAIAGFQFILDLYQKGYAPKESINWGFKDIVKGFYTGTCAFLDQDPDALMSINEKMDKNNFSVAPMPMGPAGKAFPTIGFAGWSVFKKSQHTALAWDLIAHLSSPSSNLTWTRRLGLIPIHTGADQDPYFHTDQFKAWFTELNKDSFVPTTLPTYLEQFGYFSDSLALQSSQQALRGERSAEDIANEWADFLTTEYGNWQASQ